MLGRLEMKLHRHIFIPTCAVANNSNRQSNDRELGLLSQMYNCQRHVLPSEDKQRLEASLWKATSVLGALDENI